MLWLEWWYCLVPLGLGVLGVESGKYVCLSEGDFDNYGCMYVFDTEFLQCEDGHGVIVLCLGQCGDVIHV